MTPRELLRHRRALGLTQAQFAKRLGVGRLFIIKRESGKRVIPPWLAICARCLTEHR